MAKAQKKLSPIGVLARDGGGLAAPRPTIRVPKTAEILAGQIRKMIIRGEVKEGDYLPPEGQLVEHFGTSRPTVREAFRILENEQLISVVRGSRSGARVHAPNVASVARFAGVALQSQGTLLSDVYLARVGIEPFAARLAAERATAKQMAAFGAEVERTLGMVGAPGPGQDFRLAVVRLHELLVDMAGSNTLKLVWALIQDIVEQHMVRFEQPPAKESREEAFNRQRAGVRSFGKLLKFIEARDADKAEAHWRTHMQNANLAWLSGYGDTTLVDVLD